LREFLFISDDYALSSREALNCCSTHSKRRLGGRFWSIP